MIITETKRLLLREFSEADAEAIFLLNSDPEVIRYTHDPPFRDIEQAMDFIESYNHYKLYGFGRWSVILKETKKYLGWCGLKYHPVENEYDLGFRFGRVHWGKGYATEAANACLDLGFNRIQMPVIIGRSIAMNKGSIRVLEKIGMTYHKSFDFEVVEGVIYRIDKNQYLQMKTVKN